MLVRSAVRGLLALSVWALLGLPHEAEAAAPGTTMTHLAVTGVRDGQNVNWLEKVTDAHHGD
ncbi:MULTISPECIES: hypothetical protein [Stenotrophomonas]|uniref:hypothetical protein n=1 Tax=Stenotrophomonas TaxID=40323 RepID=UPI001C3E95D0|nr:hypothetical protein [Stenotrophomonas rhizophila]